MKNGRLRKALSVLLLMVTSVSVAAERAPRIQLSLARPHFVQGEPVRLSYRVSNGGESLLLLGDPTLVPQPTVPRTSWGVRLEVTDPRGERHTLFRQDMFAAYIPVARRFFRKLSPGETLRSEIELANEPVGLSQWVAEGPEPHVTTEKEMRVLEHLFSMPGTYTVVAVYTNDHREVQEVRDQRVVLEPIDAWKGTVRSAPVSFRIEARR